MSEENKSTGAFDGILEESVSIPKKSMIFFFVIDTSGSMDGARIGAVNDTIRNIIPEINDISDNSPDANIKIAVLKFDHEAEWITTEPIPVEDYKWEDLEAFGVTNFGDMCVKLEEKLHSNEFMNDPIGCYAPVIFLMSDGEPSYDYEVELDKLKSNKWYQRAIKVALAIDEDARKEVLADAVCTEEAVVTSNNIEQLKRYIRKVSVTASKVASRSVSSTYGDEENGKQQEVIDRINEYEEDEEIDSWDEENF